MIGWMSREDDRKAWKMGCKACQNKTENGNRFPEHVPCSEHELEYANQEVKVIRCEFLDPDNPAIGKPYINDLIIDPEQPLGFLIDHIEAEEYEGTPSVLSLTIKIMTRDELNTLGEWEP